MGIIDRDTGEVNYLDDAWIDMQGTDPIYSIALVPKRTVVNPGDTIEIEVYICGYGEIERNKFQIYFPYQSFIRRDEVKGYISSSIRLLDIESDEEPSHFLQTEGVERSISEIKERGTTTHFPPEFFSPIRAAPGAFSQLAPEVALLDVPFLSIELRTSPLATPGDYPLIFTFTYGSEDGAKQVKEEFDVHINSYYERHEQAIAFAIISATVITLISLVIQAWTALPL